MGLVSERVALRYFGIESCRESRRPSWRSSASLPARTPYPKLLCGTEIEDRRQDMIADSEDDFVAATPELLSDAICLPAEGTALSR